jgi:hypothetical protein
MAPIDDPSIRAVMPAACHISRRTGAIDGFSEQSGMLPDLWPPGPVREIRSSQADSSVSPGSWARDGPEHIEPMNSQLSLLTICGLRSRVLPGACHTRATPSHERRSLTTTHGVSKGPLICGSAGDGDWADVLLNSRSCDPFATARRSRAETAAIGPARPIWQRAQVR